MTYLAAAMLVLGTILQSTDAFADGDMNARSQPTSVIVTLFSDKSTYRVGEDVRVKIAVRNAGPLPLIMWFTGPQNDSELTVFDQRGTVVAPSVSADRPLGTLSVAGVPIAPGQQVLDTENAMGFRGAAEMQRSDGFVSIRGWGYSLAPGRYTIVARRLLDLNVFSPPSNQVVINVNP